MHQQIRNAIQCCNTILSCDKQTNHV
jgi:hypothetical protein